METEAHTSWVNFPKTTLVNDSLEANLGSDSRAEDLVTGLYSYNSRQTGENKLGTNGNDGKICYSVCQNKLQNIYF